MKIRNTLLLVMVFNLSTFFRPGVVRADLLVVPEDSSAPTVAVFRFNDTTGAFIDSFGYQTEGYAGITIGPDGRIYVTSNTLGDGDVVCFNHAGQYLGGVTNGNLGQPGKLAFGPDGNCYVIGSSNAFQSATAILRYNGTNHLFMDCFIPDAGQPRDLAFGKDARLYVADAHRGIVRYDGASGAFEDVFVPLGSPGLPDARYFTFGPDGNLYASVASSNAIARFDGTTGTFLGNFVAPGSGGLSGPNGLAFGPDGNLYVSSAGTHSILRYDGVTGAFMATFVTNRSLPFPSTLAFLPPLPRLEIQPGAGNAVLLRWPTSAGNSWTVSCRSDPAATNSWVTLPNVPAIDGTNYIVMDRCDQRSGLYRLEQK
jgi:DNA-binding beta-propeller fold protein YncE